MIFRERRVKGASGVQRSRTWVSLIVVLAAVFAARMIQHVGKGHSVSPSGVLQDRNWYLGLSPEEVMERLGKPNQVGKDNYTWTYKQRIGSARATLHLGFASVYVARGELAPRVDGAGWELASPLSISEVLPSDLIRKGPSCAHMRVSSDGKFRKRFRLQFSLGEGENARAVGLTCVGGSVRESYDYKTLNKIVTLSGWQNSKIVNIAQQRRVNTIYDGRGELTAEGWGGMQWVERNGTRVPLIDRYTTVTVTP